MKKILVIYILIFVFYGNINSQEDIFQFQIHEDFVEELIYPNPEDSTECYFMFHDSTRVTVMLKLSDKSNVDSLFVKLGTMQNYSDFDMFEIDILTDTINSDSVDYYWCHNDYGMNLIPSIAVVFSKVYHNDVMESMRWATAYVKKYDGTFGNPVYDRCFYPGDCVGAILIDTLIMPSPGICNGAIEVHPHSMQSPYQYHWSNGDTTYSVNGLSEGTYVVSVTDYDYCSVQRTIEMYNMLDPETIYADTLYIELDTCVFNEDIPVDSAFITGYYENLQGNADVHWMFWQDGSPITLQTVVNVEDVNYGNILIFLHITCSAKSTDGNDLSTFYGSIYSSSSDRFMVKGNNKGISVYPNPVNDLLNVSIQDEDNGISSLLLVDISGKIIMKETFSTQSEINVNNLEKGVYLLKIQVEERVYVQKVIIQ